MSMPFDLDSATRRKLGYRLIDQVDEFYRSLPDRPVQLPAERRTYGPLYRPLPERGEDPVQVLDQTIQAMIGEGFHVASANYFGLMNPTPTYMGFLGEALAAALNPQLATLARSQAASKIELETVQWVGSLVGWPGPCGGTFTSGGNEANFSGLALAMAAHFPAAIDDGVAAIDGRPVLYASAEAHHSLDKSAGLLGLGRKALRRVAVNDRLQIDAPALEAAIQADRAAGRRPFCVVATAGTTNSGVIDDLELLADLCRRHNLWLHVDGAYGAAALFSNRHRGLLRGIERADSLTLDPHKWLAVPFAAGLILTAHPEILERAFSVAAPYMPTAAGAMLPDNSRISTQWTRRMNSLKLWLTLRVHGRQGYEELIDRQMELAEYFEHCLRESDCFELAAPRMLPIVNFRLKDSALGQRSRSDAHSDLVERVTGSGQRWISATRVREESVLRMMVISYLTGERHLRELVDALKEGARGR